MSKIGIVVLGGDIRTVVDVAKRAEVRGFDSAWTTEIYERSAIVTLAAMAAETKRITLGSGIAYGVGRSPLVLSAEARDVDEISDGRLILGLGTGTRTMQQDWHGVTPEAPAVRMEELLPLLRNFWGMDKTGVQHDGRFYHVNLLPTAEVRPPRRVDIPIYLAGVNKRMIRAAGFVGDGLVGHPLFTKKYVDELVRPSLDEGTKMSERDCTVPIAGFVITSVADDAEVARRRAKAQIAFYSIVRSYAPIMAMHGFEENAAEMRDAWARRDSDSMIDAVSDRMLETFAIAGTPDEAREQMRERFVDRYEETLFYAPSFMVGPDEFKDSLSAILDTFGRSV